MSLPAGKMDGSVVIVATLAILTCFERTAASALVPGCESTGMIASNGNDHDYCWNPYETPPVQTLQTNVRGLLGGQSYTYQLAAYDECCGLGPKSTGQDWLVPLNLFFQLPVPTNVQEKGPLRRSAPSQRAGTGTQPRRCDLSPSTR